MTIYADLCRNFDAWRNRHFDNQHRSLQLMRQVAEEFREYIGAPKTYEDSDKTVKRYVIVLQATEVENDRVSFKEPSSGFDILQRWDDGFYHFGIGVTMEVAPNNWPKQNFPIPMYFVIEEEECIMHVTNRSDGEFRFKINDLSQCKEMFHYMVSILSDGLSTSPWDFVSHKVPLGFTPQR